MTDREILLEDEAVAAEAVKALRSASDRAKQAGLEVVLVEGDELVRIGPQGRTVLKRVAPRVKSDVRVKRAAP